MRRTIGKLLISLAAILTAVVPFLADWNDSHLFSPQWSPHARFHGVVSVGMTTMLSSVALWLLWRRSPDQDAAVTAAAAIPLAYWGPFFLAPFVPGTAVEDPGHRLVRIVEPFLIIGQFTPVPGKGSQREDQVRGKPD